MEVAVLTKMPNRIIEPPPVAHEISVFHVPKPASIPQQRAKIKWQLFRSLDTLDHHLYKLARPLRAVIEMHNYEEGVEVTAQCDELEAFGSGKNEAEAIAELKADIVELYEDLDRMTEPLGKLPAKWKEVLEGLIHIDG